MIILSKDFPKYLDQADKWYSMKYKLEKIPKDFLDKIGKTSYCAQAGWPELHLPQKNAFIPTKKGVVTQPAIVPNLIRNDELIRAWYKKYDNLRANIFVNCRNPLPGTTTGNSSRAEIYKLTVIDVLEEYSYAATLAGLKYNLSSHSSGLEINIYGYLRS